MKTSPACPADGPNGVDLPSVALAKVGYVETTLADYRIAYDPAWTIFTQTMQDVNFMVGCVLRCAFSLLHGSRCP